MVRGVGVLVKVDLPKNLKKKLKNYRKPEIWTTVAFFYMFLVRIRKAKSARALLNDPTQKLSEFERDLLELFYVENLSSSWGWFLAFPLAFVGGMIFGSIVNSEHGRYWAAATLVITLLIASVGFHFLIKKLVARFLNRAKNSDAQPIKGHGSNLVG